MEMILLIADYTLDLGQDIGPQLETCEDSYIEILNMPGLNEQMSEPDIHRLLQKFFRNRLPPSRLLSRIPLTAQRTIRDRFDIDPDEIISDLHLFLISHSKWEIVSRVLPHQPLECNRFWEAEAFGELWYALDQTFRENTAIIRSFAFLSLVITSCPSLYFFDFSLFDFFHLLVFVGYLNGSYSRYQAVLPKITKGLDNSTPEGIRRRYTEKAYFSDFIRNNRITPLMSIMLSSYEICVKTPKWTDWYRSEKTEYIEVSKNENLWARNLVQKHYTTPGFTELAEYGEALTVAEFATLRDQLKYLFANAITEYFELIKT
jgi:hypothetical protein